MISMNQCKLTFLGYRQESRAKRILWIFKPKEVIAWEPFKLHLTFRNDSDTEYLGGKCIFKIKQQSAESDYEVDMPPVTSKEVVTVAKDNIIVTEAGFASLTSLNLIQYPEHEYVLCMTSDGTKETKDRSILFPLGVTNREELYQKYAVVVAIIFSVLATILTIVNVIVSVFF